MLTWNGCHRRRKKTSCPRAFGINDVAPQSAFVPSVQCRSPGADAVLCIPRGVARIASDLGLESNCSPYCVFSGKSEVGASSNDERKGNRLKEKVS